jgi:hypothetical protein
MVRSSGIAATTIELVRPSPEPGCFTKCLRSVAAISQDLRRFVASIGYQERGPCPRGSLRDRSPAAFGELAPLA